NVRHDQQRIGLGAAFGDARDERGRGALVEGRPHEVVAVAEVLQRHEEIAGRKRPRVDGKPGRREGPRGPPARGGGRLGGGPETAHIRPSSAATATEACSASSKG